jgi:hypothetical protein
MIGLLKRVLLSAGMFWLVTGWVGPTQAGSTIYVVAHSRLGQGPDLFGEVDVPSGKFTSISDLSTPDYRIFGMGFGSDGRIYGTGFYIGPQVPPPSGEYFSINPANGAASAVASLGFDPSGAGGNGSLYMMDWSSSALLYVTNPPSLSTSFIGNTNIFADGLVALDPQGHLFASANGDGSFYEINTSDASATLIGNTGIPNLLYAGAFVGSTLYAFSYDSVNNIDSLVAIDTSNAHSTIVATVDMPDDYHVIAAAAMTSAAIPEPTSLVLSLIGALGTCTYTSVRIRKRVGQSGERLN